MARHHHYRLHVNLVDIRSFLPVDFNGDKKCVEKLSYLLVVERLTLHNMAPVA
jgi:pyruvate/2-oxoglutarate/acetoin dehydrogenase E1 component